MILFVFRLDEMQQGLYLICERTCPSPTMVRPLVDLFQSQSIASGSNRTIDIVGTYGGSGPENMDRYNSRTPNDHYNSCNQRTVQSSKSIASSSFTVDHHDHDNQNNDEDDGDELPSSSVWSFETLSFTTINYDSEDNCSYRSSDRCHHDPLSMSPNKDQKIKMSRQHHTQNCLPS
jgi:hypothetical protein